MKLPIYCIPKRTSRTWENSYLTFFLLSTFMLLLLRLSLGGRNIIVIFIIISIRFWSSFWPPKCIFSKEKWWQHALQSVHLKPYYAHEEREDQKQNDAWGSHHVLVNQTCKLFARVPQFLDHLICDGFPRWQCLLPYLLPILT